MEKKKSEMPTLRNIIPISPVVRNNVPIISGITIKYVNNLIILSLQSFILIAVEQYIHYPQLTRFHSPRTESLLI